MSDPVQSLKDRLNSLENSLKEILEATQQDLQVARALQSLLMPNRLPEIVGLQTQARYISAKELSSESFDLIPSSKNRELWIVASWTSNFGLSSVLLQSLLHIKSQYLTQNKAEISPKEVFAELSATLAEANKKGAYRLLIAKLDLNSLKLEGCAQGYAPLLVRQRNANFFGDWTYAAPEGLVGHPEKMKRASSLHPTTPQEAYHFQYSIPAGSRFYLIGKEWNTDENVETFWNPLRLRESKSDGSLLDDLNHLMIHAQEHLKKEERQTDITGIAFELNSRILHLA